MDDETRATYNLNIQQPHKHSISNITSNLELNSSVITDITGEPAPKKRCLRNSSTDFTIFDGVEDPTEVCDSGFSDLPDLPTNHVQLDFQNGDLEVGPFFDVGNTGGTQLFGSFGILNTTLSSVSNNDISNTSSTTTTSAIAPVPVCVNSSIRTSSLDTLSLGTETNDFPEEEATDNVDEDELSCDVIDSGNPTPCSSASASSQYQQFLNNSTNNSSDSYSTSDQFNNNLNTSNLSSHSEASGVSGGNNQSHSSSTSTEEEEDSTTWDHIFKNKEISQHPSRALMMQRFLSHLRNNPNDTQLQHFLQLLLSGPEFKAPRERLRHITTMADAIRLFRCSKKILVLTGAGISVSCGIPDFRSKDGLYARVSKVFPFLRDPQSVFDIRLFKRDPRPFFLTAKELYPGQFEPSLSHKFIRNLEKRNQLLRNYSQNIDTLEDIVGINKVTMCHGSFATATCIRCKHKVKADDIKEKVLAGDVPYCPNCSTEEETSKLQYPLGSSSQASPQSPAGLHRRPSFDDDDEYQYNSDLIPTPPVLKPDIVFFGEDLPEEFHNNLELDKHDCDLLLVIGSSLRVRPVSMIPGMLPAGVPQILINRESLPHCPFDIELLGNCDAIIAQLCRHLGPDFADLASKIELREVDRLPKTEGEGSVTDEVKVPQSADDIQALRACWEPKVQENIAEKLPENSYLNWRPHQYVFEGAEVSFDPDDEDDDDDDDTSSDSDSDTDDDSFTASKTEKLIQSTNSTSLKTPIGYIVDENSESKKAKLEQKPDN